MQRLWLHVDAIINGKLYSTLQDTVCVLYVQPQIHKHKAVLFYNKIISRMSSVLIRCKHLAPKHYLNLKT